MTDLIHTLERLSVRFLIVFDELAPPEERELLHIYTRLCRRRADLERLKEILSEQPLPLDPTDRDELELLAETLELIAAEYDWRVVGGYVARAISRSTYDMCAGYVRARPIW